MAERLPGHRVTRYCPTHLAVIILVSLVASAAGCATTGRGSVPAGTQQPDQFLFDKGSEALQKKKWLTAREYFKQVTETYTQSSIRPDAKLGVGDTFLGEGSTEALVLAIAEFQEFLSFYPTHARADYAQYKLGMAHFRQMRSPQRDQTETRDAIRNFEAFVTRYPSSALMEEVSSKLRQARDRLSTSELEVGRFYVRIHWYPGAIDRLSTLLKQDPAFTGRDGVYYFLGEALLNVKRQAEALPLYEKLVKEFDQSQYLQDAKKRIEELTHTPAAPVAAVKTS